ncbi:hypothetical protein BDP27DRAFT_1321753 [Rhodocollybia butyracea]|uniref:VASt domain-containing protein n=1 Tax=Rhodocollybia butyracea TaxID=206335 RepID=A0A9P5PYE9_9AGAR|nr:hypothetical protein BDP27DRAFT_1321753 [Rhodocollybia butyracea]
MAPGFLSKLVRNPSGHHTRDRSEPNGRTRSPSPVPPVPNGRRSRALSSSDSPSPAPSEFGNLSKTNLNVKPHSRVPSIKTQDNSSDTSSIVNPNFMIVPPSPKLEPIEGLPATSSVNGKSPAPSTAAAPTAASTAGKPSSLKSSSTHSLQTTLDSSPIPPVPSLPNEVRKMPSNRSLTGLTMNGVQHSRAATAPAPVPHQAEVDDMTPIVESPTSESPPDDISTPKPYSAFLSSPQRDSDAVSIRSTGTTSSPPNSGGKKKEPSSKPWRRTPTSKPSGLASAIAASGLAMANPAMGAQHQAQISPPQVARTGTVSSRKASTDGTPYMSRSGGASSSTQFSPSRSTKSRRSSIGSSNKRRGNGHRKNLSVHSDNGNSEFVPDAANLDYYSGLESDDSEDESMDESDDDDIRSAIGGIGGGDGRVHEIPVTGFAVASSRRNADFHEMFRTIPEGDYLIEDYGCALQREILIQGRLYISENHICFHANILGWITDLSIPIDEITALEKKMTAFVIPNAILITTRQAKYSFASFLSRDTTYDVIYNIWRLVRPGGGARSPDTASIASGGGGSAGPSPSGIIEGTIIGGNGLADVQNKVTQCKCGKEGKHYSETALNTVIPGTPEKIHNLMFTSGFIKDFLVTNQKLMELQMSDWSPGTDNHLSRTMSYIKPLNGSIGPRQTKCEIRDEVTYLDFAPTSPNAYSSTLTTTRTPDVPSGSVFSVKTLTCITYASAISSRVVVTTELEWTGKSWFKSVINSSAIDGQKTFHQDLEKAMRAYIREHQTEFVPEGVQLDVVVAPPTSPGGDITGSGTNGVAATDALGSPGGTDAVKGPTTGARGAQWAWDTFDGAWGVARKSTKGALELLGDVLPSMRPKLSSTSVLYLIILGLVMSNIWTWMRVPKGVKEVGSGSGPRRMGKAEREDSEREDRERWIHGVVTALWDELAAGKGPMPVSEVQLPDTPSSQSTIPLPKSYEDMDIHTEVAAHHKALDSVEERIKKIRDMLNSLSQGGGQEGTQKMNELDELD